MKRFPRCAALALLVLAAVPALTPPAPAQRPASVPFAYRADAFRRILFELGLTPLKKYADVAEDPKDTLLVVLGQTDCLHSGILGTGLRGFVEDGGAALIATDRAPRREAAEELVDVAGVTVSGKSLVGPAEEADVLYHGKDFCPFLDPISGETPDLFRVLPVPGSPQLRVAANAPSQLEVRRRWTLLPELARLPASSHVEGDPPPPRPPQEGRLLERFVPRWQKKGPLFAVGGPVGDGRILVLADHSIFINQMMVPTDNNNVEFAWNCLKWLQGEGEQRRHKVLFVEDGTIQTNLKVPLKESSGLPPGASRAAVLVIDDTLAKLEDKGTLDEALLDRLGASRFEGPNRLVRRALEVLTVVFLVYFIYRVGIRGRFRLDAAVPLLAHEVARHTPAAPLMEQRYHSALKAGNLWETAHALARQWFASLALGAGTAPPEVVVRGGWWQRSSLRRRFRRLWRLAHDSIPVRVTPRALRALLRDLDEMKAALADGTIRLP
jgi:hypothetical protein